MRPSYPLLFCPLERLRDVSQPVCFPFARLLLAAPSSTATIMAACCDVRASRLLVWPSKKPWYQPGLLLLTAALVQDEFAETE
jgi:hypothetical protein